ncbi:MAG: exopolyphosphatase [Bacteroidetes bacterium]|nr:exopolyphosphatase [Bacteroidota bacterium]
MNLITRSDFDGLTCAVLLKEVEIIEQIKFAHPRDIQEKTLEVTPNDILTNLPYHPNCGLWFDHHASESARDDVPKTFNGRFETAPSAARVIVNHYRSHRFQRFDYLMYCVDKIDAARLTIEDVTDPKDWVLLSYVMDPRTGLGKYHDYGMSNKDLMSKMIDLIGTHSVEEILAMHDIKQRVARYFEQEAEFRNFLASHSTCQKNVIVTDQRGVKDLPTGNRFLIYTLFPDANVSIRIMDGREGKNVVAAIGHSIFNRTSKTHVGDLCAKYGGGGHRGAGTTQIDTKDAEKVIKELIEQMKKDG